MGHVDKVTFSYLLQSKHKIAITPKQLASECGALSAFQ